MQNTKPYFLLSRKLYPLLLWLLPLIWLGHCHAATTTDPKMDKLPLQVIKPQVRITKNSTAKYEVDLKYLKQHLDNMFIADAGEDSQAKKLPFVANFVDRHILGSVGTKVLVKNLPSAEYPDLMFVTKNRAFIHPITGEMLGIEYAILGTGTLLELNKLSVVEITSAKAPIEKGAKLVPRFDLTLPETIAGKELHGNQVGYILANINGLWDMVQLSAVVISLGARDGMALGDILGVYHPDIENMLFNVGNKNNDAKKQRRALLSAQDKPLNRQGDIMIYKTFEKLSLAVVVNATNSITVNDLVKPEPVL